MNDTTNHLNWLPPPPNEWSKKLAATNTIKALRAASNYSLNENQLVKLANKLDDLKKSGVSIDPLISKKMLVLSNTNVDLIYKSLAGTGIRYGIDLCFITTEFNQIAQICLSDKSILDESTVDYVLLGLDYRSLPFKSCPGDELLARHQLENSVTHIKTLVNGIKSKSKAQIIIQNFAQTNIQLFGSFETQLTGTTQWFIKELNKAISKMISGTISILDIDSLSAKLGLANWHNPTIWNIAKLPFSFEILPIYSEYLLRVIAASMGKSRRCLVLDLDNTLWGGIIGDDGINGILLGNGNPTGEAFTEIQEIALELRNRGIVLAVSSKNEYEAAISPFNKHPEMKLKLEHIAVFQANWYDKATNIRTIAKTLSLGLESIVFFDDNPAERMQVRNELPEVAVPELPDNPALYPTTLANAGYFEAVTFSDEDKKRASFYESNNRRQKILGETSDIESYLKSLQMEISFSPFDSVGRSRIAQLISKSNQFNLTTKRYTEAQIESLENNGSYFTRQIRLRDNFGDNGMISVIICKKSKFSWEIDTWLMSCRVLGRRVEVAALQDIIQHAKNDGAQKIIGHYIKTERNIMVKDHYASLGFKKVSENETGDEWVLDIDNYQTKSLPMTIKYAI